MTIMVANNKTVILTIFVAITLVCVYVSYIQTNYFDILKTPQLVRKLIATINEHDTSSGSVSHRTVADLYGKTSVKSSGNKHQKSWQVLETVNGLSNEDVAVVVLSTGKDVGTFIRER